MPAAGVPAAPEDRDEILRKGGEFIPQA